MGVDDGAGPVDQLRERARVVAVLVGDQRRADVVQGQPCVGEPLLELVEFAGVADVDQQEAGRRLDGCGVDRDGSLALLDGLCQAVDALQECHTEIHASGSEKGGRRGTDPWLTASVVRTAVRSAG